MNNRNALLFEFGHQIARVVTRSFDDLDATLKDDSNVFVIGRWRDGRQYSQVHTERLIGHLAAALDLLGQVIWGRLGQCGQDTEATRVRYRGG